ncbi:hypothetical protein [Salinarimonas rosea]|uniref:hypothetical protein n=1 Tax=Salinarimonas rosea TaxID=552063 RepID=UPI0004297DA3|nr:hypothetical protein [Salinarimonas rosea]
MDDDDDRTRRYRTPTGIMQLWAGWALGPIAWAIHQNAAFWIIPALCESGSRWPLWLITAVTLAVAVAGGAISHRAFRALGSRWPGDEAGTVPARSRFLAAAGVGIAGLSSLGIVVESVGIAVLDLCAGVP